MAQRCPRTASETTKKASEQSVTAANKLLSADPDDEVRAEEKAIDGEAVAGGAAESGGPLRGDTGVPGAPDMAGPGDKTRLAALGGA